MTQHLYHNGGEFDLWRASFSITEIDTGYAPIAASELKTKLKSRQAVYEAAGVGLSGVREKLSVCFE